MADRFSADPTVVFMTSVLEDIASGKLLIPRFQRPLVWKWEQRRDLLSSIYEGLPIGALMLWVSDSHRIGVYDSLGPHRLPAAAELGENRYLMDGVQRISTLYGAMRAQITWEEYDEEQDVAVQDFVVYADLEAVREQDRFLRRIDIDDRLFSLDPYRYLPLSIVLDSRELLKFQRSIPAQHEPRIEIADSVATAFRQYKVPLISLKSASLEVVTKSFQRVNSRGADMSELHMLNALSYSSEFDLLARDRELREELLSPLGWSKIDQEVVLRCIKLKLGDDIYTTNPDDVSDHLKKNTNAIDDVFIAIAKCAEFLSSSLKITRPEHVPYRMQIVGLAGALFDADWRPIEGKLSDWFWISTYTEAFGSSARQSENALNDLLSFVRASRFVWSLREKPTVRPLENLRVDFRSARVKALALALANRLNEVTKGADGTERFDRFGREAFSQVVFDKTLRGRAGFRFLLPPDEVQHFRTTLLNGDLNEAECKAHFLNTDTMLAANSCLWKEFVTFRERDIWDYERSQIIAPAAKRIGLDLPGLYADLQADYKLGPDLFADF